MSEATSDVLKKKSSAICKLLIGVSLFFGVMLVQVMIGLVACFLNPSFIEKEISTPYSLINIFVTNGSSPTTVGDVRNFMLASIMHIVLFMICVILAYFIFKEIKYTINPFSRAIIKRIRVISILTALNLCSINAIMGLGVGIIIFGIAIVFEYGAMLQQLSDETL